MEEQFISEGVPNVVPKIGGINYHIYCKHYYSYYCRYVCVIFSCINSSLITSMNCLHLRQSGRDGVWCYIHEIK